MKKALSLALCGALIFSLAGCGGKQTVEEQSPAAAETPVVSEQVKQAEETKSPVQQSVQSDENNNEISAVEQGQINENLVQTYKLSDLSDNQIGIFEDTSKLFLELAIDGIMTVDELDENHRLIIDAAISENELPVNGHELYSEWKELHSYYDQFGHDNLGGGDTVPENSTGGIPSVKPEISNEEFNKTPTTPSPGQNNKPQPSVQQQQQQAEKTNPETGDTNSNINPATGKPWQTGDKNGEVSVSGTGDGYEGLEGGGGTITRYW